MNKARFNVAGDRILTASDDHTARIWSAQDGRQLLVLRGHENWIFDAAFAPDGKTIATASDDETIKIWEAETGVCLETLAGHGAEVNALAFRKDATLLATGSENGKVILWERGADAGWKVRAQNECQCQIRRLEFSRDGDELLITAESNEVGLWDLAQPQMRYLVPEASDVIEAVIEAAAFDSTGNGIVVASRDGRVGRFLRSDRRSLFALDSIQSGHRGYVTDASFSPSGEDLATGSSDATAKIWRVTGTGRAPGMSEILRTADPSDALRISGDGSLLAVGGSVAELADQ